MNVSNALPRLQAVLFCAIGLLAAVTVYVSALISQQQQALQSAGHYNVSFTAGQTVNEYFRALQELTKFAAQRETSDPDMAALRLDILVSRMDTALSGDFLTFLESVEPENRAAISELNIELNRSAPLIDRLDQPEVAEQIVSRLEPLEGGMIGLASAANNYGAQLVSESQSRIIQLHWLFSGITAALIAAGFALILLLVWSKRLLGGVHQELLVTADDLARRTENLRRQNTLFDAAINNMSQGLCMFGAEGDLIVANRRFSDIYGLPGGLADQGMNVETLADRCAEAEIAPRNRMRRMLQNGTAENFDSPYRFEELNDGRVMAVNARPIGDGGWVVTHEDVTKRHRAEERLAYLARNDTLTGLPNRNSFGEALSAATERLRSRGENCAVVCFDLDRFKNVNDTLGHRYGDLLLVTVAERTQLLARETDIVARFGGDEFAVLLDGVASPDRATAFARDLIETLTEPYDLEGHKVIIGVSVGVALVDDLTASPDELVKNADTALYRAKASGGNDLQVFDISMDVGLQARRSMELDLWNAFRRGEFELAYQPQVNLLDCSISGVEALLRWNHPERGYISPAEFIPVAEDIGLIEPLGGWVLRQACREVAAWPKAIKVAVNLSPVQFVRGDLLAVVSDALKDSGLPPEMLELEITESLFLHENSTIVDVLDKLRSMNIRFALDDFGTGYSSLSYIRRFPIDKIKIDKSFVDDIVLDREALAIVRAVTTLGSSLDISTTAEGIETVEQMRLLHLAGCNEGQGYLFSRPITADQVIRLLDNPDCFMQIAV